MSESIPKIASPTFTGKITYPIVQEQVESLLRILERFTMEGNKHIQENFNNHQEANSDPYLRTQYVIDMAVAATLYTNITGGQNLYHAASMRGQGLAQASNPQSSQSVLSSDSDGEISILDALEHNRSLVTRSRPTSATDRARGLLNQIGDEE